jgi:hypothetical protein
MRRRSVNEVRSRNRWLGAALVALALGANSPALADESSDRTLAETLFQEGKKLMAAGSVSEACDKLSESQRLDPAGGTLLLLGLCHEKLGRTATAWGELREALALAVKEGQPSRVTVAERHIAALEPLLSRLSVIITPEASEGVEIHCDGEALSRAAWGIAFPINPGSHRLEVSAPGKRPWATTITVLDGDMGVVTIGPLDVAPTPSTASSPTKPPAAPASGETSKPEVPAPSDPPSSKRDVLLAAGFAVGGVSVISLAVATAFGVAALNDAEQVKVLCPGGVCTDSSGPVLNDEAKRSADLATGFIVFGALGALATTALFVSIPLTKQLDHRTAPVRLSVAPASAGARGGVTHDSWAG